ncbi:asparagine synthase C-terminal domain-containing protein [Candidatus Woesearchaeota archaeon]|nr:asparagine synthase C-terminal domain-containing protein [Candidatus Woesearchaeota archaeon]
MELWLDNGNLIEEKKWIKKIDNLKTKEISNKESLKKDVKEKLTAAIEKRWPKQRFGILFSGGVDSSAIALISKQQGYDFTCLAVGFQDGTKLPDDIKEAKKVAQKFNFDLRYKIFNLKEAEEIIKKTVKILKKAKKTDVVNVGVGAVVLAAIEMGKEENIKHFMGGLGSEEIFAGYERHAGVKDVQEECWRGLKLMWGRDLVRDFNLAKVLKVVIRTPFLDEDLIKTAMQVPAKWKLTKDEKKIILREVADEMGLGEMAWRKKKAAQYGSCFDKAIGKLAKKNNFKLKKDYLNSL